LGPLPGTPTDARMNQACAMAKRQREHAVTPVF